MLNTTQPGSPLPSMNVRVVQIERQNNFWESKNCKYLDKLTYGKNK